MSASDPHGHAWNAGAFSHDELRTIAPERYRSLFDTVRIGPKTAPNRFLSVPYSGGWGMHEINLERAHRRTRAEGGWGVVSTAAVSVAPESTVGSLPATELFDDGDMRLLAPIADAVHEFGALAAIELTHFGGMASPTGHRVVGLGPTQLQSDAMFFSSAISHEMRSDDIRRVQDEFVAAARRSRQAGFDIVYIHCAHSSLPMQFLAPFYNHRTDEYGGDLINRARFLGEVLQSVRQAIGDDTAVACRFAIEALGPGGLGIDEALETVRLCDPYVDLWDLVIGGLANSDRDLTPSLLYEEGASLEWTRRAKQATEKPVVGAGRFTDIDLMARIVRSGELDFIGAARPGIAEPFLPRKIAAGEFGRIRECIGSNRCAYSEFSGSISCSQNATMGEEHRRGWHPERFTRASNADQPVLIVGAGPAGLECATVLARRGFEQIHIVDAADRPGGHMRWVTQLPGFNPWGRVIEHRQWQIEHLRENQFVPRTRLDAKGVLDYGAQIVIVATGSRWATTATSFFTNEPIPGADARRDSVLTPEQIILEGKAIPGRRVLVYDCQSDQISLGIMRHLQALGHEIVVATPFPEVGSRAMQDGVGPALRAEIAMSGGSFQTGAFLTELTDAGATVVDETMTPKSVACDATVLLTRRASDDELFTQLARDPDGLRAAGVGSLYQIGDCVAPQDFADAIFSGHRLAREIDSANPAYALPALRG